MASKPDFDIAIVGGGISGLCLALSISSHTSIPITIYEAAPAFGEIGAGVAFGPNAVRAMSLISGDLKSAFEAHATINQSPEKKDVWFDFRIGMDGQSEEARARGVKEGVKFYSVNQPKPYSGMVHRAHFLDRIVNLLPQGLARFGKTLVRVDDQGAQGVVLTFEDGTQARHSAVIGSDGIHSKTRQYLLGKENPKAYPVYTGKYCYRAVIPMTKAAEKLGPELAGNCQAYLGYHGHVLTFPVAEGRMMNVVAFYSSKEWKHEKSVIPATREQIQRDFDSWGAHVKRIIEMIGTSDIWALFDHPPIDGYAKGRVCIVGDAAHASTPFQGAGAGMAVEDAYTMGRILQEVKSAEQLPAAFKAFDLVRRERTQKLVATSRESGHLWHFELDSDDIGKITEKLKGWMSWIWDHDFDADMKTAVQSLRDWSNGAP